MKRLPRDDDDDDDDDGDGDGYNEQSMIVVHACRAIMLYDEISHNSLCVAMI